MSHILEIWGIATVTGISCSLIGTFLVLRRLSMMVDAITHTVFLGIVLAFLVTKDLNSPWLIIGATAMGVGTVYAVEWMQRRRYIRPDAAIGIVFPFLFALAIVLVTLFGKHIHLDVDTAILGDLAFATFQRFTVDAYDLGPMLLWIAILVCLINAICIALFKKELILTTFDPVCAKVYQAMPMVVSYGLMTLTSLTTVASFQTVGAILVTGCMIGPPATAFMLARSVKTMLFISMVVSTIATTIGVALAFLWDVSIGGMIATVIGCIYGLVWIYKYGRNNA